MRFWHLEMCHVRRRDNLTAANHMVVEAAFWFYPLVWWIRARLVEEREQACDEAVLQSGSDAEVYAEGILNVCKFYVESPLACVSGISGADLRKRVVRIMTYSCDDHFHPGLRRCRQNRRRPANSCQVIHARLNGHREY
jgi:beta-lactamase regulating signal transducer with metallopeptidase domain